MFRRSLPGVFGGDRLTREAHVAGESSNQMTDQVTAPAEPDATATPDTEPVEPVSVGDWTPPSREEWERQQSAIAGYRRDAEKAEKAARLAAEAKAKEEGRHQELAEQYKADAEKARAELEQFRQHLAIEQKARDMKFRRPDYALRLLPEDVDRSDPVAVEQALQALLADDPSLKADTTPQPTGGQPGGAGPRQTLDEQIAEAEANKDWKTASALKAQKLVSQSPPTST